MAANIYNPFEDDEEARRAETRRTEPGMTESGAVQRFESLEGDYLRAHDLNGKTLVDINDGQRLGNISEVMIDPDGLRIAALVTSRGGLLNREDVAVPASAVQVWGKDVVLVSEHGQTFSTDDPKYGGWIKLSDQIKGRYVVSTDGTRVGQVDDLLIDSDGRLAGYDLSQVFLEDSPLADHKRIPAEATSSFGKDVLIVDMDKVRRT